MRCPIVLQCVSKVEQFNLYSVLMLLSCAYDGVISCLMPLVYTLNVKVMKFT